MIEALVDRRLTTWELAAELNNDRIPIPSAGRKASNTGSPRWSHRRVRDILKTARGIAGRWTYTSSAGSFTIAVPAIVSEQRHQQLHERLAETSTGRNATKKKHNFLLARRVTSECGHTMHGYARPDGTGRCYRCSMSTSDRGPDRCDCQHASADAIETAAWNLVAHELTSPERLQRLAGLAANLPDDDRDGIEDIQSLDRKVKRLETALGSDIAELLASGADPATIRAASQELERRLEILRTQRTQALHWAAALADQASQLERVTKLAGVSTSCSHRSHPGAARHASSACSTSESQSSATTPVGPVWAKDFFPHSSGFPETRRKTGTICPTCNRYRTIPTLSSAGSCQRRTTFQPTPTSTDFPSLCALSPETTRQRCATNARQRGSAAPPADGSTAWRWPSSPRPHGWGSMTTGSQAS